MKIYTSIQSIDKQQWAALVERSPWASFFQTEECYHFFESLSFLSPFVCAVVEGETLKGLVCGYLIADGSILKRYMSRRAIICGGPLLDPTISSETLVALLQACRAMLHNRAIYTEFRNYHDYGVWKSAFEEAGFKYIPHLNFHVPTVSEEGVLKQLNTTKRRDVRLMQKGGVEWCESKDLQELNQFYDELRILYQTKVKTPLFPYEFFEKLIGLPNGKFFVVKYDQKVVGGSICVELGGKILYEWFVCGMDGRFKNVFPSTAATWAAIAYSAKHGLSRFDMMGAGKPDEGYGVREFKSKFGGELVEHGRFLAIHQPRLYALGKKAVTLKKEGFHRKKPATKLPLYTIETDPQKIDRKAWRNFIDTHPDGNLFHCPEMYDVYTHTPNQKPIVLIAFDRKKTIAGCLMAVVQREYAGFVGEFTTRSISFGGPIISEAHPQAADALLAHYNTLVQSVAIYSQFRNMRDQQHLHNVFATNGFRYSDHLDILLDLKQDLSVLEANLHRERRRNIQKATREGLEFRILETETEMLDVVRLLQKTYQRVGVPLSYESLFRYARQFLGAHIRFFGAYYEGKMIAGQIRLCYKNLVYAWYAGSDSDYFNKKPNDFLMWNVLLWSKAQGYERFDFGGAGKPGIAYGVRDYKLKYGGELVCYGRYERVNKPVLMKLGKQMYAFYKRINKKQLKK